MIIPDQKFLILHSASNLGWHFFDWSINYLSGNKSYFSFKDQQYQLLSPDPLVENKYAHKHHVNFIESLDELNYCNQLILSENIQRPVVLQARGRFAIADELQNPTDAITDEIVEKSSNKHFDLFVKLIKQANELGFSVITFDWSKEHFLIPLYQPRTAADYKTGKEIDPSQLHDNWQNNFFNDSKDKFNESIWDRRERLALNIRLPLKPSTTKKIIDQHPTLCAFTTNDIWFNLHNLIECQDQEKFSNWEKVYKRWQKIFDTKFSKDYWVILNAILNGNNIDLSDYKLDFVKEALIQHGLLYKYNLNIRTWQLTEFPKNTAEIHKLLEPNFHWLEPNYCKEIQQYI